jgi:hypothetical protein
VCGGGGSGEEAVQGWGRETRARGVGERDEGLGRYGLGSVVWFDSTGLRYVGIDTLLSKKNVIIIYYSYNIF